MIHYVVVAYQINQNDIVSTMLPVRCYTCGKVIKWSQYIALAHLATPLVTMSKLGIRRYCCQRMILTSMLLQFDTSIVC